MERLVGCDRVDARLVRTRADEFALACDVMEEYMSAYGYYGDEWHAAWTALDIRADVKQEVLSLSWAEREAVLAQPNTNTSISRRICSNNRTANNRL